MIRSITFACLLFTALSASAATRTSTQTGNWSDTATWGGSAAPVDGDIAVIATGHTVTVTADAAAGNNGSNIGDAVTINATDGTTFGKLIVNDGVTLTLKGNGTASNRAMLISRYAQFEPLPGATIVVDCASNFQTVIDNRGIINAIGTAPKPITFTCPAGNVSWANTVTGEAVSGATAWKYDPVAKIATSRFANFWLANSGGTALGSLGDTSVSFGGTNASAFGTEKSSLAGVTASGDYYINYDMGIVWFYWDPAGGNPSFTKTYKYLTTGKGWGILSDQNTTYNEAKFDHCIFRYMGSTSSADSRCLSIKNKQSAAVAANRLFYLKNSTVEYCNKFLGVYTCTGTLADPLLIEDNTINTCGGDATVGAAITFYRAASTYLTIQRNTITSRVATIHGAIFGSVLDFTGLVVSSNTCLLGAELVNFVGAGTRAPNGVFSNNTLNGVGNCVDYRAFSSVGGSSGNRATISDNLFSHIQRGIHYTSYVTIERNIIDRVFHHGIVGPIEDDAYITDVTVQNNLFIGEAGTSGNGYDASTSIESGYNHRQHIDSLSIINNTAVGNPVGLFGFGDQQDTAAYTLCTRLVVANNLCRMNTSGTSKAWQRRADSSTNLWRGHVLNYDHNLDYNYNTRYTSLNRQGTFSKGGSPYNTQTVSTRNIPGVALFDPNFSTASGKTLDLTYTSATDQTLSYDGGTAVQLVIANGTATAGANNSVSGITGLYSGSLTDSGASFNTTKNNAACPAQHWVKLTGGTGSGQIRAITNNTATVLTVTPAWTTVPDTSSTYVIIRAEVQLTDGADTVQCGVYLPDFPTSTVQDTGISFADNSVTGSNPLLANSAGTAVVDYKITTGSPALNVGDATYAPATDYYGTSRPIGAADDLGFFELPAAASSGDFFLLLGSCETGAWRPIDLDPRANPFASYFGALAP